MKLNELRKQKHETVAEMKKILDMAEAADRDLTEDEQTAYDALDKTVDSLSTRINRVEQFESKRGPTVGEMSVTAVPTPGPTTSTATAQQLSVMPEAPRSFDSFGHFMAAVDEAKTGRRVDGRLSWQDIRSEQRMDVGASGGFMVPAEFRADLLAIDPAATPLLGMARTLPADPSHPDASLTLPALDQTGNQYGGVTVSRIGEGHVKPETDLSLEQITWTPRELAAHVAMTDQIVRNWAGCTQLVTDMLRAAINGTRENEILRGAGGLQYTGIIGHPSSIDINRTGAGAFVYADMVNMVSRFLERGGPAMWLINPTLKGQVMAMANAAGFLVWNESAVDGIPGTLDGKPVYWHEFASAVGAQGDVMLVRPQYYVIKEGSGPFVDIGWINNDFVTNRRRVKIFLLDDGQPWMTQPFTLANGVDTVSPFITLDV